MPRQNSGDTDLNWDVVVIGAGAAGLMAATTAAWNQRRVLLLEKNRKPGVKILMSGGTRCNLTHATDERGIVEAFGPAGPFLHSALARLGPQALIDLFESYGVATKVESTGKVFPESDKAYDVLQALREIMVSSGAMLATEEPVERILRHECRFHVVTSKRTLAADSVILTSGGQSYPGCGTTGDGYSWARELGHSIVAPRPALVPLKSDCDWVRQLKGVTVADVALKLIVTDEGTQLGRRRGSFLFTHFGVSGPAPMDLSRFVTHEQQGSHRPLSLQMDFLPEWTHERVAQTIREAGGKKLVVNVVSELLIRRLGETLCEVADVNDGLTVANLPKAVLQQLVTQIKAATIPVSGTLGFKKAEVTAGGVELKEVRSKTMESKLVPRLFLAGEILDLDGPIGGYNFQAAFSTGWLAGENA